MSTTQTDFGKTKHGYSILAMYSTPRAPCTCAGRVVLADRGPESPHRYVTWWENTELGGYSMGHYIEDRAAAEADFAERCRRGF